MKTSNYLIISPFFFPESISTGKYNGLLAKGLIDEGLAVDVICSHPIYPSWVPTKALTELPGTTARRGGLKIFYPSKPILRRVILEVWFAFHVTWQMLRGARNTKTVIAVFPPSLFMPLIPLLAKRGTHLIGIVHDLQGVYASKKKGLAGRFLQSAINAVEGFSFKACSHLIFLSHAMRDSTVAQYKINVQRTSVQYPFVTTGEAADANQLLVMDCYFEKSFKSFVYSGALGEKQAPAKIIELMRAVLELYPDWCAHIFSEGPIFESLRAGDSHPRLYFHHLVSVELLPALLARSDIQLVPQAEGTSDGSLPSKVPNIIASGAKLLCITDPDSELAKLVGRYVAGEVVMNWNISECLAGFNRLVNKELHNVGSADILNQFTLKGLIQTIRSSHE